MSTTQQAVAKALAETYSASIRTGPFINEAYEVRSVTGGFVEIGDGFELVKRIEIAQRMAKHFQQAADSMTAMLFDAIENPSIDEGEQS